MVMINGIEFEGCSLQQRIEYGELQQVLEDVVPADPPDTALRYNTGKVDYALLPVKACESECKVWMQGEKKYGRSNWRKLWGKKTVEVAMASLMRHCMAILDGEIRDSESGEYHAGHIRCNAAMLIEHYSRENK